MKRPHVIGLDDAPFDKFQDEQARVVGVVSAGSQVEGILTSSVQIDGEDVTAPIATWIRESSFRPVLRAIFLDSITIGGLGIFDLQRLHALTDLPVLIATRKEPRNEGVLRALHAAGLEDRAALLAQPLEQTEVEGGFLRYVGVRREVAVELHGATRGKSVVPEPVRLAHMIGQALELGASHGKI